MASAFAKEVRRSIAHSLGRFIALFAISALGVGFYAGLLMTGPDMRMATDEYYDGTVFHDIRIVSTLGVDEDDVHAIRMVDGVAAVMAVHETDVLGLLHDEQYVFRIHSLPDSAASSVRDGVNVISGDPDYLNRLLLEEGRWPAAPDECLISGDRVMSTPQQIGDVIEITSCSSDLEETLTVRHFTVVGFVKSPDYISGTSLGTSSLGSGEVQQFMYVTEGAFADGYPYTDLYVRVAGATALFAGSEDYKAHVQAVEDRIRAMVPQLAEERTARVKAPYEEDLAEAQAEYDESLADYEQGVADYEQGVADYEDGEAEYEGGKSDYESRLAQWQRAMSAYRSGLAEYNENLDYYRLARDRLDDAYALAVAQLGQEMADELYAVAIEELAALKAQLDAAKSQLDSTSSQLAWAKRQLDAAASQLADAAAELADAATQLDDAKTELDDAKAQLDDGAAEIARARQELDDMAPAEYFVLDRTKNYGAMSHEADSNRIDSIAQVFPFIFFLVAALVALTTMTRMVEEERTLIGTFKALGYGKRRIISKYLIYAATASVLGAVVGVAVLSQVLPRVIHNAYGIVYFVPEGGYPINWGVAVFATLLGVGIILLSTWWAAASTLRQRPGELLLPRAPKAGKRIFLEHVPIIWSNLSFSWKVTCRNLFRYKKRLIMTVIGIAGCTALLVTGWGLRDAINDIIDIQFGRIVSYNLTISTDEEMSEDAEAAMREVLEDPTFVEESTPVRKVTVLGVPVDGGTDITVEVIVPKSRMAFADFVETRNRTTGQWLELGASGVVVTEKLAKLLGVGVGDRILLYDQDATGNRTDTFHSMRVAGIMENYIYDYVYVAPDLYEEIWGEAPAYNLILAKSTDDADARAELTERLRAVDGVRTVGFTDEIIDTYRTMLSVVDLITWVLIIAAAALAFIVLWNLTNINITEREREIATLKVLGFTRGDVYAYIYREVALLAIIGAAVGILLGIWLEGWVVVTAEVDQVMFGRTIHTASYLISLGLTFVFAAFVMLIMRHKLDHVNMVESLKSVE